MLVENGREVGFGDIVRKCAVAEHDCCVTQSPPLFLTGLIGSLAVPNRFRAPAPVHHRFDNLDLGAAEADAYA